MSLFDAIKRFFEELVPDDDCYEVTIKQGDRLYNIAHDMTGDGNRWKEAEPLNPGKDLNDLHPGDVIKLPHSWFHH